MASTRFWCGGIRWQVDICAISDFSTLRRLPLRISSIHACEDFDLAFQSRR